MDRCVSSFLGVNIGVFIHYKNQSCISQVVLFIPFSIIYIFAVAKVMNKTAVEILEIS